VIIPFWNHVPSECVSIQITINRAVDHVWCVFAYEFRYFFDADGGKKIRPAMVLAVSYALNYQPCSTTCNDDNNSNSSNDAAIVADDNHSASASQKRLAEITEMIHTASLFHDDVIDKVTLGNPESESTVH
jgi:geranylgeranyl pyrophosphate synthase